MTKKLYRSKQVVECRPTEQQLLLLQAALLQGESALAAWRAWRLTADLDQLPPGGFALLPLLAYNLQQHGVNDDLLNKCHGIHRRTWTQNQLRLQTVATLLQSMQDAGLTPLVTGDLPLALLYYPAQGVRAINQLHLWTPAAQATAMQTQLAQTGWVVGRTKQDWLQRLLTSGLQRFHYPGDNWSLYWHQLSSHAHNHDAALWQHTRSLSINGMVVQCANVTDLFLTVCVQGIADFWRYGAIQWLADAMMLLRSPSPTIDWSCLVKIAAQQAFSVRMASAVYALQHWLDAPIPPDIFPALATSPTHPFERWAVRFYSWLPRQARPLLALWMSDWRHTL